MISFAKVQTRFIVALWARRSGDAARVPALCCGSSHSERKGHGGLGGHGDTVTAARQGTMVFAATGESGVRAFARGRWFSREASVSVTF